MSVTYSLIIITPRIDIGKFQGKRTREHIHGKTKKKKLGYIH